MACRESRHRGCVNFFWGKFHIAYHTATPACSGLQCRLIDMGLKGPHQSLQPTRVSTAYFYGAGVYISSANTPPTHWESCCDATELLQGRQLPRLTASCSFPNRLLPGALLSSARMQYKLCQYVKHPVEDLLLRWWTPLWRKLQSSWPY